MSDDPSPPHFPGRPLIDAYGNGGFRFAGMSHKGSLLIIPSGVYAWTPTRLADVVVEKDLSLLFAESRSINHFLIGSGSSFEFLPENLRHAFRDLAMSTECMDTGAAARTYNILLSEGRQVAAALIVTP